MKYYIISILITILMVTTGVQQIQQVQSQTEVVTETKNKNMLQSVSKQNVTMCNAEIEPIPDPIDPDIIKVQQITGWDLEISTYFIEEANARNVSIFEEALPIVAVETGHTYRFDLTNKNTNGTHDGGAFQINGSTYTYIIKQLKAEGREFDYNNRLDPKLNIASGMYWISYLKGNHQLENHKLFTSYNRGVAGAKQYASRCGTYETRYSREVIRIKNELIKQ